ncbi:hypothetical protein E2C01_030497 [Portunus trituberculatus]|uniref:Uncharacterized protein n=1 Tax=Portunus trituberculatus TaxID=210409 RepID=A0A5B7EVW6_PORTR|nr:hypothetical protein [Portunus trituberculatus]
MMGQSTPSTTVPQVRLCFTVEVTLVEAATAFRALSSSHDDEGSAGEVLPSAGLRAVCLSRHSMPPTLPRRGRVPGWMSERTRGCVEADPSCSNARASRLRPPSPCHSLKLNPEIGNGRCRMTTVAPSHWPPLKHLLLS